MGNQHLTTKVVMDDLWKIRTPDISHRAWMDIWNRQYHIIQSLP